MTAYGGSTSAIKAMQHGAYDYVTKPFDVDDVLVTLRRLFEHARHDLRGERLRLELGKRAADRERIVGSPSRCWRSTSSSGRSPARTPPC